MGLKDKIKDALKKKVQEVKPDKDLEWDKDSSEGKGVKEQPLPAYTPEAFNTPTRKEDVL